jgi:hypothetical protein
MIHTKTFGLPGLLAIGLLPIFASTEVDTDRRFLSLQTPISRIRTADDPQPGEAALPGNLRWVRGSVLSWTADSLTLQLKKGSLTLDLGVSTHIIHAAKVMHAVKGTEKVISIDQLKDEVSGQDNEAEPDSLAVGSLVQAHYVERNHKSYAILLIEETNSASRSLKTSGSSYLGVYLGFFFDRYGMRVSDSFQLLVDGRKRQLYPFPGTTFVDLTGDQLKWRDRKAGDTLLITYRIDFNSAGPLEGVTLSPITTTLEIRRLTLR